MNGNLTAELRNDLVAELVDIRAIIAAQRELEKAALTLLGFDPDDDDDDDEPPASSGATFTAVQAKRHLSRKKKRGGGKRANLTDDQVRNIRKLVKDGASRAEVGDEYGLSRQTISNIVARKGCYGEVV